MNLLRLAEIQQKRLEELTIDDVLWLVGSLKEADGALHRINMQTSLASVFGSETDPDILYMPTALICRILDGEEN